jgi:hypothetical protein
MGCPGLTAVHGYNYSPGRNDPLVLEFSPFYSDRVFLPMNFVGKA